MVTISSIIDGSMLALRKLVVDFPYDMISSVKLLLHNYIDREILTVSMQIIRNYTWSHYEDIVLLLLLTDNTTITHNNRILTFEKLIIMIDTFATVQNVILFSKDQNNNNWLYYLLSINEIKKWVVLKTVIVIL